MMAAPSINRRQARILAMQTLCHLDVTPNSPVDATLSLLAAADDAPPPDEAQTHYARHLLETYHAFAKTIDELIAARLKNWDMPRLDPVDRNVLRVAVTELTHKDVPPKVANNEAIEIARDYGSADSPPFVNGLLDNIRKFLYPET